MKKVKPKHKPSPKSNPKAKPLPLDMVPMDYRNIGKPFAAKHKFDPKGKR